MSITFTFGGQPVTVLAEELRRAAEVREPDVLYALDKQKSRILDRTARGVDVNEQPFAPYSTNGPYYYYPNRAAANRRSAVSRTHRRIGEGTRTRLGIKFTSYGAFKRALGRSVVDLLGPSAPHMLQAIVVKTTGADGGVIGIYGAEADRAEGHNVGAGHLPRREFFGASPADEILMARDIEALMSARIDGVIK